MSRREFLKTTSAATVAVAAVPSQAATAARRVFIASDSDQGIVAFDWNPATGDLTRIGGAAQLSHVDWIRYSPDRSVLFAAIEVESFNDKPTGEVASFRVQNGELHPLSAQNSAGKGTCYVALDHTAGMLLSADYGGGSAASFLIRDGALSPAVWTEHFTGHGPVADRQEAAHAHFASFAPDNRFAYINDLGSDCIHIFSVNVTTAMLTPAGTYHARAGAGCRTLHFHPNGRTAYCVNELDSTVDVLHWNKSDGNLTLVTRIDLLPEGEHGLSRACDTVITKDGRFVYFANRDVDFIYAMHADAQTGALKPIVRSSCGGKIPRNFVLDPTERWMLVANQDSNWVSVFARDPQTGKLAEKGKNFNVPAPMCILF